ncbi:hypothetical protein QQ045_011299 [Rhodiola kirilowii]
MIEILINILGFPMFGSIGFFVGFCSLVIVRNMAQFGDLNNDLLTKVFSLLPTKTLARVKCVCKWWFQLISHRTFIQLQLKKTEPLCGFFFQARNDLVDEDVKYTSYIPIESNVSTYDKVHHKVFDFLPEAVTVQAITNGLVCSRSCLPCPDPHIYICNPLNKEWVTFRCGNPPVNRWSAFALAFDPFVDLIDTSTHFKVIRVQQTMAVLGEESYYSFEIFSSRTQQWRVPKEICCCMNESLINSGVCINGILYWLTSGDRVLTFNVENELSWLVAAPFPTSELETVLEICIGESEGQLNYVLLSVYGLQVWALEDIYEPKWIIKSSTTLEELENENNVLVAEWVKHSFIDWVVLLAFRDGVVLVRFGPRVFILDINSKLLEERCRFSALGIHAIYDPLVVPYTMTLVLLL